MQFDKVRVPKEIHQKETIAIHIPKINRPLTYRQIYFFLPGFVLSFIIQYIWIKIFKLPDAWDDKIFDVGLRIIVFIFVPFMITIISGMKRDGKYLEEILFRKVSYSKKSAVVLNEKALRAIKNNSKNR